MTFERLKGKINVLEIVWQRVPGCRTGVGKRPSLVRGQIDTGGSPVHHDQLSVGDGDQERRTQVGRVPTGIQVPCCVDTCTPGHTLWTAPGRRRLIVVKRFTFAISHLLMSACKLTAVVWSSQLRIIFFQSESQITHLNKLPDNVVNASTVNTFNSSRWTHRRQLQVQVEVCKRLHKLSWTHLYMRIPRVNTSVGTVLSIL